MTALAGAPPWAIALLREARVGRLATADTRARPLVLPVCFVLADDALYSAIDAKPKKDPSRPLRRLRNIEDNDQVALVVDVYDEDWSRLEYLLVRGRASVVDDAAEFARALSILRSRYPQYVAMRLELGRNDLVRIEPSSIHHWKGAGR